ncbi:MAG: hypothetical protein AAF909_09415 [Pseudomonadota bacterium]
MVDIFILFHDDAEAMATRLAWAAAERGYTVWGDPAHFADVEDDELAAAARGARAVAVLWSPGLVAEAERRVAAFEAIPASRAVSAILTLGLELPGRWRDLDNQDLTGGAADAVALKAHVDALARIAGATSSRGGAAVERLRAAEEDAAAWRALRDVPAPEAFDAYLKRFGPRGLFARLARQRRSAAIATLREGRPVGPSTEENWRPKAIWGGVGAGAAAAAFGLAALLLGGGDEFSSDQALALQNEAEISADLDAELSETRTALSSAEEALKARDQAMADLEIALAEARSGEPVSRVSALAQSAPSDPALEARLATLQSDRTRLQQALRAARRDLAAAQTGDPQALAEVRAENRRVNAVLDAARLRIEALEADRAALRAQLQSRDVAAAAPRSPAPAPSSSLGSSAAPLELAFSQFTPSDVVAAAAATPAQPAETLVPVPRPRPGR